MAGEKPDVMLLGSKKPVMVKGLEPKVNLHYLVDAKDPEEFIRSVWPKVQCRSMPRVGRCCSGWRRSAA